MQFKAGVMLDASANHVESTDRAALAIERQSEVVFTHRVKCN